MKKTVLITGATGFVGHHVLKQLLIDGNYSIKAIIRPKSISKISPHKDLSLIFSKNLFLESEDWWKKKCEGVDIVLHLAWYVEPGKYLNSDLNFECLSGSLRLSVGAIKSGVKKFIAIGTCFEYDLNILEPLAISTPLLPKTIYANAKVALFRLYTEFFILHQVAFTWCRLFYLYGDGEDERRLIPYIRSQLSKGEVAQLTSGKQVRDYMDVQDAAKMLSLLVRANKVGAVNICSGNGITIKELAEKIADEYNRRDLLKFGARPDNLTDPLCIIGDVENFLKEACYESRN